MGSRRFTVPRSPKTSNTNYQGDNLYPAVNKAHTRLNPKPYTLDVMRGIRGILEGDHEDLQGSGLPRSYLPSSSCIWLWSAGIWGLGV